MNHGNPATKSMFVRILIGVGVLAAAGVAIAIIIVDRPPIIIKGTYNQHQPLKSLELKIAANDTALTPFGPLYKISDTSFTQLVVMECDQLDREEVEWIEIKLENNDTFRLTTKPSDCMQCLTFRLPINTPSARYWKVNFAATKVIIKKKASASPEEWHDANFTLRAVRKVPGPLAFLGF